MTTRPTPEDAERATASYVVQNLADVDATDTLLDDIGGRRAPEGDPIASALTAWLNEIDAEYQPMDTAVPASDPGVRTPARRQSHRRRHRAMVTAALTLAVAAGSGVAAASPGSLLFPVHQALFGPAAPVTDPLSRADSLLNQVQAAITSAHGKPFTATEIGTLRRQLREAMGLLVAASPSTRRTQLIARHDLLAKELREPSAGAATTPAASAPPTIPTTRPTPTGQVTKTKPGDSGQPTSGDEGSGTNTGSPGAGDTGTTSVANADGADTPGLPGRTSDPAPTDSSESSGSSDDSGKGSGGG